MSAERAWRLPLRIEPSSRSAIWRTSILFVLLIEGIALVAFLLLGEDNHALPTTTRDAARPATDGGALEAPASTSRYHTNVLAGYSFIPPKGWEIEDNGSMSTVTSPDGDAIAALGPAFAGSVHSSSERLLNRLRRSYRDVQVETTRASSLDGRRAIVTEGSALNEAGVAIQFGIYTIEGRPNNYAIGLFEEASRPSRGPGGIGEGIFRSFTFGV